MPGQRSHRIVVVGLGHQGARSLELLARLGHDIVGAVDIGDKVGVKVADLVPTFPDSGLRVSESTFAVLDALESTPDVVAITAALPKDALLELAGGILDRGVNVITLHPDVFGPDASWTPALHARAVAGGATFLATGLQDLWWVQIPAIVAASSVFVDRIRVQSVISVDQLGLAVGDIIGIGLTPAEFEVKAAETLAAPAVLGDPLLGVAHRLGLVAGEQQRTVEPILAEEDYHWASQDVVIPAGRVVGTRETVSIDTDRGIRLEGLVEVVPVAREETADELHVYGVPEHHLRYQPFDGFEITNVGLISRVPDVVEAPPGVIVAADLPPATHQLPREVGA